MQVLKRRVPAWAALLAMIAAVGAVSLASALAGNSTGTTVRGAASDAKRQSLSKLTTYRVGGYKYVQGTFPLGDDVGQDFAIAKCPKGTQAVGGGGGGADEQAGFQEINFSSPWDTSDSGLANEDGWAVAIDQLQVPANPDLRVGNITAICKTK